MKRIVKEEQPFERLEISKEDLMRLFGVRHSSFSSLSSIRSSHSQYNPFKVRILNEKVHTPTTTVYRYAKGHERYRS